MRDRWIGWDFRSQFDRQHLLANSSRFLILPGRRVPNLGARVLSPCARRLATDWPARFGHPLLETFVNPARHRGTVCRAANWTRVGHTCGFRRVRGGHAAAPAGPRPMSARPWLLTPDALDPIDQGVTIRWPWYRRYAVRRTRLQGHGRAGRRPVAAMQRLYRNPRCVFDHLRMTETPADTAKALPHPPTKMPRSLQPGKHPRPLTRKEVPAIPPSLGAYFHASNAEHFMNNPA